MAGTAKMQNEYDRPEARLSDRFNAIPRVAVRRVRTQIGLLLNNLQAVEDKDRTALDAKKQLQRTVKTLVLSWSAQ